MMNYMNKKDYNNHRMLRIKNLKTLIPFGFGELMTMAKTQDRVLYNVSTNKSKASWNASSLLV